MADEVTDLHFDAQEDVRNVLNEAYAQDMKTVVVLGIKPDGTLYADATKGNSMAVVYLMEDFKWNVLRAAHERTEQEQGL